MNAKHTPAPWRAERWSRHAATTVLVDDPSVLTGKRIVAECETEEDAQLIAASPDLADALVFALDAIPGDVLRSSIRFVMEAALVKAGRLQLDRPTRGA